MATLGYWNFRGLGQPVRFLLAYLNVPYTHHHYDTREEWFAKDKLELTMDFPNLPYYIDDEIKITESSAIPVYLIKKYNKHELLGQNHDGSYSEKEVRVQQVQGVIKDLFKEFFPILFNPQFETVKEPTWEKITPLYNKLIAYLGQKDFLVGTLSYSDFVFYELLSYFRYIYPASITPTVAAYINRFENLPGIKEYIANPNVNLKLFLDPNRAAWSGPK